MHIPQAIDFGTPAALECQQHFLAVRKALLESDPPGAESALIRCVSSTSKLIETHYNTSIPALRSITTAKFSKCIDTAAISITKGNLLFNPDFFLTWLESVRDLAFLLLHERGHIVLNYVANTSAVTGFEEDAIINIAALRATGSTLCTRLYTLRALQGALHMLVLQNDIGITDQLLWQDPAIAALPGTAHVEAWYRDAYEYGYGYGTLSSSMLDIRRWREQIEQGGGNGQQGNQAGSTSSASCGQTGQSSPQEGTSPESAGGNPSSGEQQGSASSDNIPDEGYGSGEGDDCKDVAAPLGHEESNADAKDARGEDKSTADAYKNAHPDVYDKSGSPTGDSHDVSFAGLHIPRNLGMLTVEAELLRLAAVHNAPLAATGLSLTTMLSSNIGGMSSSTYYDTCVPRRITPSDAVSMGMGRIPTCWEHESTPRHAHADMYLDFSGSMDAYWGLAIGIADALRFKIRNMYGFATMLAPVDLNAGGVSVGGGTALGPVIEQMQRACNPIAVLVSDLEFWPRLDTPHGIEVLTDLLGRKIKRLIVCYPVSDTDGMTREKLESIKARYFGGLPTQAYSCIHIFAMSPQGTVTEAGLL